MQKDPVFGEYMTVLRKKVNDCLQGRHKDFLDLRPPGFREGGFPCLMNKSKHANLTSVTLKGVSTLETEISTRLGRSVKVSVSISVIEAQMLVNGELDRLKDTQVPL